MPVNIVDRFMYGDASLADQIIYDNAQGRTPQERAFNELTQAGPKRQRALLTLTKQQIEAQQLAAKQIVASNIAGAEMVATEIQQQTRSLEQSLQQVGTTLTQEMSSNTEKLSYAVEQLGDRISMEMAEMRWEMAQQNQTLEKILHVLRENRSNETRQLVQQGIRLYINEQYDKAEERFKRALDYDMTDYQVLMNLAYIELHKGDLKAAYKWFKDALNLPENLNNSSKSRTLWAIARIFYTAKQYDKAFDHAQKVIMLGADDAHYLYTTAVYAALSKKRDEALRLLHQAITKNADLFARAAADPELASIRQDVIQLLSALSRKRFEQAQQLSQETNSTLKDVDRNDGHADYKSFIAAMRQTYESQQELLQEPSYSHCTHYVATVSPLPSKLRKLGERISHIDSTYAEMDRLEDKKKEVDANLTNKRYNHQKLQFQVSSDDNPGCLLLGICYLIPSFTLKWAATTTGIDVGIVPIILWPLGAIFGFFEMLSGEEESAVLFFILLIGIFISGIILVYVSNYKKNIKEKYSSLGLEISSLESTVNNLESQIRGCRDSIQRSLREIQGIV